MRVKVTATTIRREERKNARCRLRALALECARAVVLDDGWRSLRMSAVGESTGTTRQALHAEFGTHEDLVRALLRREAEVFFDHVAEHLDRGDDCGDAVRRATRLTTAAVAESVILQAALTGSEPVVETRGPPLTTQSGLLLTRMRSLLCDWLRRRCPAGDDELLGAAASSLARLFLSHAVLPALDTGGGEYEMAATV